MNAKYADNAYIEKAQALSDDETERVLSRMGEKLRKRKFKDKIDCLTAVAIQLEIEDDMLNEWRENFAKIKARHDKKEALNAPVVVPEKPHKASALATKPKQAAAKTPTGKAVAKKPAVKPVSTAKVDVSKAQPLAKPKSSGVRVAKPKKKTTTQS